MIQLINKFYNSIVASILKSLKLIADPSRLRLLLLLECEELSVAELQEILAMGQSRISTHLSQLKAAGLLGAVFPAPRLS